MLILAGCAPASPPQAARVHPTIVSLNPCSDAVLTAVADPGQILAISAWSQDPASSSMDVATARRFRATGGTVEEVLALRPDVVVAGSFLAPATRAAFARLGVRVESVGIAHSVAESEAQVRDLARIAGHPQRGEAMVAGIEAALAAAAPPPGAAPIPALMWEGGGMVPGDDTLVADLMRRTGFASVSDAMGRHQADKLPLEQVLAHPPRVIFAAGDAQGNEDRMLRHPTLSVLRGTMRAAFSPSLLFCGGPTIARAAARLAQVRNSLSGETVRSREGGSPEAPGSPPARGRAREAVK
ncbi:MAG: ABC transporter substrate-binding protein [Sphingomonadales bacterium]|nr:ABC transporter substrate-binding protein [Sphingomonadales bacterium]MDE2570490.1 ABC transporter substrate-binding protein [Sphingomonadales bacterium]